MATRTQDFINHLSQELSESEIAAGLTNGDIQKPEWLGVSENLDHLKVWDTEETNESSTWGFVIVNFE